MIDHAAVPPSAGVPTGTTTGAGGHRMRPEPSAGAASYQPLRRKHDGRHGESPVHRGDRKAWFADRELNGVRASFAAGQPLPAASSVEVRLYPKSVLTASRSTSDRPVLWVGKAKASPSKAQAFTDPGLLIVCTFG